MVVMFEIFSHISLKKGCYAERIFFLVLVFSYFFCVDVSSLSLLPFDQEEEKQRYIFRSLTSIERHPVWFYGDVENGGFLQDEENCLLFLDEIDQSIDLAFYERGLDPADWLKYYDSPKWYDSPWSATLKTLIGFYGKMIVIDVGLFSEALLLESQVFIPAVIWKKKMVLDFEGKEQQIWKEVAKHAKTLVGHFLDDYTMRGLIRLWLKICPKRDFGCSSNH